MEQTISGGGDAYVLTNFSLTSGNQIIAGPTLTPVTCINDRQLKVQRSNPWFPLTSLACSSPSRAGSPSIQRHALHYCVFPHLSHGATDNGFGCAFGAALAPLIGAVDAALFGLSLSEMTRANAFTVPSGFSCGHTAT
jgi:hypothetical protein